MTEKIGTPDIAVNSSRPATPGESTMHHATSYYETNAPRKATYEFSRDRKSMSVLVQRSGKQTLLVKGAPESILERCSNVKTGSNGKTTPLSKSLFDLLSKQLVVYGNRGLRVIALASVDNVGSNSLLRNAKSTKEYTQL